MTFTFGQVIALAICGLIDPRIAFLVLLIMALIKM
jgi:hypothetical protein